MPSPLSLHPDGAASRAVQPGGDGAGPGMSRCWRWHRRWIPGPVMSGLHLMPMPSPHRTVRHIHQDPEP